MPSTSWEEKKMMSSFSVFSLKHLAQKNFIPIWLGFSLSRQWWLDGGSLSRWNERYCSQWFCCGQRLVVTINILRLPRNKLPIYTISFKGYTPTVAKALSDQHCRKVRWGENEDVSTNYQILI